MLSNDLRDEINSALKTQPEWLRKRTLFNVERYLSGSLISKYNSKDIYPISDDDYLDLISSNDLDKNYINLGETALKNSEFAYFIMAGGVATSMGGCIKALVRAKENKTFIEYKLDHIRDIQKKYSCKIPVILMLNDETKDEILTFLNNNNLLKDINLITLVQPVTVRFQEDSGSLKVARYSNGKISYVPGGHYDSFILLNEIKDSLKDLGIKYILINNIDNLSVSVDPKILGAHIFSNSEFSPEIIQKVQNEKGGVYIRLNTPEGKLLRQLEGPMVPDDYLDKFQDSSLHKYFNTNNIYLSTSLFDKFEEVNNSVPVFLNRKVFDDIKMFGFESAVGLIFGLVPSKLLLVERNKRFFPIKYLGDLWLLRSNFSRLENNLIYPSGIRPKFKISSSFLSNVDDLDSKIASDSTNFLELKSLELDINDGRIGKNVTFKGDIKIKKDYLEIKDNEVIEN